MSVHSFFDAQGRQLGDLFDVTATPPGIQLNTAGSVAAAISSAALAYLQTREQRRLEQTYLRQNQTPPGSLLTPGQQYSQNIAAAASQSVSIPWPLILLGAGAILLVSKGRK